MAGHSMAELKQGRPMPVDTRPRDLDEIVAGAVKARSPRYGSRHQSGDERFGVGTMTPSETGVGTITPLALGGWPSGGCVHSPPMTVARAVLPMLPRAQVGSASERFEHLGLGTLEPVVPCTRTGDLARLPGLSSASRFLTQPTSSPFCPWCWAARCAP